MTNTRCKFPSRRQLLLCIIGITSVFSGCKFISDPVSPAYTRVSTLASAGEPFGIAVKDSSVFVSDGANGTILQIDGDTPPKVFASGLNTPSAIAFLPDGDLVVADTGSHTIRKIASDGMVSILAGVVGKIGNSDGPADAATFNAPIGIAADADGSVYVSDTYNDRIRVIREGRVSTIAGSDRGFGDGSGPNAKFDTPLGIAIWGDRLLVADSGNARIRVVEKNGDVWTLTGNETRDLTDGPLSNASFVRPTAIATDHLGQVFIADGNALRVIGRRTFPFVETVAGDRRGFADGNARLSRFNRPSGLAIGAGGELFIADSDNRVIRVVSDIDRPSKLRELTNDPLPLANRWPYEPPFAVREIAGTLGEIRGDIGPENKPVWFHNGLDIAGAYGETARFLRDETVLDPLSAENFGTPRELLRLPLLGYIHLRLGRDKTDIPFGDERFQFERDPDGRLSGVRVRRGTRFAAGDVLGTLNAMNHVHLIAGRPGHEINAFAALSLPGVRDFIAPVIEDVSLFTSDWRELEGQPRIKLADKTRIVVRAYDRMDGNSERRRLGVYRVGYQLFSNGAPVGDVEWRIRFDRTPSNDAVQTAYAYGSRSGYTSDTIFNYIATNQVDGENYREDFLDTSTLAPGVYALRAFAGDFFGNVTSRDVEVERP